MRDCNVKGVILMDSQHWWDDLQSCEASSPTLLHAAQAVGQLGASLIVVTLYT
jgi:hypothetical protein